MSKKVIAAIDLGSHALRMKIGEINKSGKFKELESIRKIAVLGHDTFTRGKLSFESVDMVCDLLKLFKQSFEDYGVEHYEAMATSAIREASNKDYIVDQIKLKTGLDINIISNSEEQFLTHKAIKENLENYSTLVEEGAVIVVVGAGSIQITTYKNGKIRSSQNVKMGALRVREAFFELDGNIVRFNNIMEEYITTNLEGVDFFNDDCEYKHLIAVGGEINIIRNMIEMRFGQDTEVLSKKKFYKLYKEVSDMTNDELEEVFHVKHERAKIILPSMMLFKQFLIKVTNNEIIVPQTSLSDGIIRSIHENLNNTKMSAENIHDMVTNAKVIAKKFGYNQPHSEFVENTALYLFDRLKRLHGMKDERVLLNVAAVLHDIGKFVSLDQHYLHSYEIIRSLELFGMSDEDMELIANIAFYHSMVQPHASHSNFSNLSSENRTKVAKLASILRIADSIDRSHKGKIKITAVKFREKKLTIHGSCDINIDTALEEWTFKRKAEFFTEVYGVTPLLKIKRELL